MTGPIETLAQNLQGLNQLISERAKLLLTSNITRLKYCSVSVGLLYKSDEKLLKVQSN